MKHSYSILVVAALPAEMRVLKRLFAERKHERIHVSFLTTGMGNFAMTHALTKELEKNQYDFILNLGICGYGSKKLDMVQIVRSVYAPTQKELLVPVFTTFASLGSIMCDEKPVKEISDDSIQYADMESYGFEWVASKYLTPRVVLKIPIDQIGESLDLFDRDEALGLFEKHIDAPHIFETIIAYLD
jgi:nucleoside phosphorylase